MKATLSKLTITLLSLIFSINAYSQSGAIIRGRITGEDNKPIEFITIALQGTGKGAMTDARGLYEIKQLQPGNYQVTVSGIGFKKTGREINITAGSTTELNF